ncbi:MAG: hypothetical protein U9Q67_03560, partial [Patescibacteria group bacterium]|nr:hypothetical protein [Patescibacteria group bacterium]
MQEDPQMVATNDKHIANKMNPDRLRRLDTHNKYGLSMFTSEIVDDLRRRVTSGDIQLPVNDGDRVVVKDTEG